MPFMIPAALISAAATAGSSGATTAALGNAALGGAGSGIGSTFLGGLAKGAAGSFLGNKLDLMKDKSHFEMLEDKGLTPQEIMGGGGGSSSSTSGTTMGNQATQMHAQKMQLAYDAKQKEADRDVQKRGQDITAAVASNRLNLDTDRFNTVDVPQAARDQELHAPALKNAMQSVINTDPKWMRLQKILTMAPDNVLAQMLLNEYDVDITDPVAWRKLHPETRGKMINDVIASINGSSVKTTKAWLKYIGDTLNPWIDSLDQNAYDYNRSERLTNQIVPSQAGNDNLRDDQLGNGDKPYTGSFSQVEP